MAVGIPSLLLAMLGRPADTPHLSQAVLVTDLMSDRDGPHQADYPTVKRAPPSDVEDAAPST